jgi:hypothetical protein
MGIVGPAGRRGREVVGEQDVARPAEIRRGAELGGLPLGDALVEHPQQLAGVGVEAAQPDLEGRLACHAGQAGRQ